MATSNIITTNFIYSIPPADGSRAFVNINVDATTGKRVTNVERLHRDMKVENVRGKEDSYSLNTSGFQFNHAPTKFKHFRDDKKIEEEYYQECIDYLKKITGGSRIAIFDHTRRLHNPNDVDSSPDRRQPVTEAHVDQTLKSATNRVNRHMPPEEAPELLRRRFQIVNLWRPIGNPALDFPLGLCDFRSVDTKKDTFPLALVYPTHEGETMGVGHNPSHEWKYQRGMSPDEIVLIKCFDSLQDGSVALFTPHSAFVDPTTPADAPHRESIEVRALIFYD